MLFDRVCRENGITAKLTKPYSPTTTGKIERWHQTLRRELLDDCGPFTTMAIAQAALSEWVRAYNHARPHQPLNMDTPVSLFRPNQHPEPTTGVPAQRPESTVATAAPDLLLAPTIGAVEFKTVVSGAGQVGVNLSVQRLRLGTDYAGALASVWADEHTVHVLIDGKPIKTVPSNLDAEHLHQLRLRGARSAGPPPALPAVRRVGDLHAYTALGVDPPST